jgi:hypothetical protein
MSFHFLKRKVLVVLLASFAVALLTASAMAQSGTSAVTGSVTDPQGQVVPGASVTLVSVGMGTRRSVVTDDRGVYSFNSVQPGAYTIEVEAAGFKKAVTTEIQALVDKTTDIPIGLEVGEVSVVVTVDAGNIDSIINTQDASLGNNFVSQQISQLPLEGRNVVDLLSLQPGVTPDGAVAGGRQDQANITLDGIDVNDQQTGLNIDQTDAFSPVLRVTPDSIEEFRVTTLNPDASRGRSAGAQVSLITKGGSNEFRGNLFEYHRNTVTTANSYFNNLSGIPRPKLIRNLFGGSLGGPVVKDRLFFFYNYEGMREAKQVGVTRLVPLAFIGQGNMTLNFVDRDVVTGNIVGGGTTTLSSAQINALTSGGNPVVDVNPVALALFASAAARYPANQPGVGDGIHTGGFRFNAPLPVELNTHTARLDWGVTRDQKHQISFRANYQQDIFGGAPAFPDTPATNRWSHPLGIAASHTWLIKNNMTNRFNYGLTRLAYSNQGDSAENAVTFRDVFSPALFARTFSRVNPTHNITNDFTWTKNDHTLQFGTNIRIIRNKRTSLARAFDNGVANFGFYQNSGSALLTPVNEYLQAGNPSPGTTIRSIAAGDTRVVQTVMTAVLGRLSQYTANFSFNLDGTPISNAPTIREWATEEYDWYAQDSWRIRQNLTLNLGIRYGLSRPVYETQGFQAAPNIPLDVYFQRRLEAAERGENYTEPLIIDLAGPKNGRDDFYEWDKNNWQPRISAAWSPDFKSGWLGKLFGRNQESVFRGGFAITNDYFGQQLAVSFDANNTLGFGSAFTIPANSYNITTMPAPLYTGPGMTISNLPGVVVPGNLVFPLQQPANNARRIEASLDRGVQSPINYSWSFTYGRKLPLKTHVEVSYIARLARNLLATRDVMMPNNIKDPASGQTWYQAAGILELLRRAETPLSQVPNLPFFENLYAAGRLGNQLYGDPTLSNTHAVYLATEDYMGGNDWTFMQHILDVVGGRRLFYQSQYGALSSFGTIAKSDYHGMSVSLRQRMKGLTWDLNYTFSKSLDDASGLQTSTAFGSAFILNPILQSDSYAASDFDMRHIINFNSIWKLPIGRSEYFLGGVNKFVDAFIGGWQLSTVVRYNTGVPFGGFFDDAGWTTNWNLKSNGVAIRPVRITSNPRSGVDPQTGNNVPNFFSNPQAAYNSFRSPLPGETGDRNRLRFPSYFVLDAGLVKSFGMPWSENHKLSIRWDVFNVTNTARFTGFQNFSLGYNPNDPSPDNIPPPSWANFSTTQGSPRIMQFAIRFDF